MNLGKILKYIMIVIGWISIIIPLIYWGFNPGLTEMQIFIKMWPFSLIGILFLLVGYLSRLDDYYESLMK